MAVALIHPEDYRIFRVSNQRATIQTPGLKRFSGCAILSHMQSRHEHNGLTWIDLESPTREEVRAVAEEFGLHEFVANELLLPTTKPRVEFYGSYIYTIVHFPALRHTHKTIEQEIDFIVGKNYIITAHYDTIDSIHKFTKLFEVHAVLDRSEQGDHAGLLFFYMIKRLYQAVEYEIDYIRGDLAYIDENVFAGDEVNMVEAISRSARDLLNLRQTIEPHRDVLRTLEADGANFFGQEFIPYLRSLSNEYYRVHNRVMRLTESLHELRETNNSLLSTKQNEIMKVLTIMVFVTYPLSLIAGIFGMNTLHNPIVGNHFDFWIIILLMASCTICMFLFFKYRKWL